MTGHHPQNRSWPTWPRFWPHLTDWASKTTVTTEADSIEQAQRLVVPGVGSYGEAMSRLAAAHSRTHCSRALMQIAPHWESVLDFKWSGQR